MDCVAHSVDNLCFVDPVTPQTLEAALEFKEIGMEHEEDLFEDMDLGAWVFLLYFICYVVSSVVCYTSVFYYYARNSEPESPVESISSAQTRMSPLRAASAFKLQPLLAQNSSGIGPFPCIK